MTTSMTTSVKMLSSATESDGPRVIALESNPSQLGGTYLTIDAAAINDTGDVAFVATLANSTTASAIFLQTREGTRALVKAGDAAPLGGNYKKFLELDLAQFTWQGVEGMFLLFRAELEGNSSPEGMFLWSPPDTVEVIALTGTRSPRGSTYKSFSQPAITAVSGNSTVNSFLAFTAVTDDGSKLLIQKSSIGGPEEVLATGDKVENKVVGDFVMSPMGAFAVGCVAEIRRKGKGKPFNEVLIVGPGYIVNGGVLKEGTVFEGTGRVKRILGPPAIAFQVSFVALEFKKGGGIAARDVYGNPGIVAKTSAPVPGLPDETIKRFGPPIANSRIPISGPQAIVSRVRLSSGRSGLWAHIFRFGGETEAETKLLLIEGSPNEGLALRSVVPLKVNNNGALLLRATVGERTSARKGVFVMNGLFD